MEKRADKKAREIAEANLIKEIKAYAADGAYDKALEAIKEIDIPRLKGTSNLILIGEVYMQEKMYDDAVSVFNKAYNKAPNNRRILELLTGLYIEKGDYSEAEYHYKEFIAVASRDVHRYILRYRLDKAKGERSAVLIDTLEHLKDYEYMEEWALELAQLYHKAGDDDKALRECDEIQLWFGHGPYVNQALRLKSEITGEDIPLVEDYEAVYDDQDDDAPVHTGFTDATIDVGLIEQILNEQEQKKHAQSEGQPTVSGEHTKPVMLDAQDMVQLNKAVEDAQTDEADAEEAVADEVIEAAEDMKTSEAVEASVEVPEASEVYEEENEAETEAEIEEEMVSEAPMSLDAVDSEDDDDDDDLDIFDEEETPVKRKAESHDQLFDELSAGHKALDFWGKRKKQTRRFFKKRSVEEIARDQMVAEASKSAGIQNTGPLPEDDFLSVLRKDADREFDALLSEAEAEVEKEAAEEALAKAREEAQALEAAKISEEAQPEQMKENDILAGEAEAAALFEDDFDDDDDDDDDDDEMITESEMSDLFSEDDFTDDEDEIIGTDMSAEVEDLFSMDDFDGEDDMFAEAEAADEADDDDDFDEIIEPAAADPLKTADMSATTATIEFKIDPSLFGETKESSEEAMIEEDMDDDDEDDMVEERVWTDEDKTFINGLFSEPKTSADVFGTVPNIDYVKEQLNKTFTRFDEAETAGFDILAEYDINFVVLANDGSIKSQIALGIAKALNTYGKCDKTKIVRASAGDLNGRDFSVVFEKLKGGCLIIDQADQLDDNAAAIIENYVKKEGQQTAIVFSSTNEDILGFWKKHQQLRSKFLNVINVSKYNEMELVNLAKGYIEQKHYELDPESALVLRDYFKKCLDNDQLVNYEDVMGIVDAAIAHLESRNVKNLFMTVLDNKYEEAKMFKLLPMDFKMLR